MTFKVTCFVWHLMFNRIPVACNLALRGVSLGSSSFLFLFFLFEGQGRYGACVFQVSNSYNRKACLVGLLLIVLWSQLLTPWGMTKGYENCCLPWLIRCYGNCGKLWITCLLTTADATPWRWRTKNNFCHFNWINHRASFSSLCYEFLLFLFVQCNCFLNVSIVFFFK